MPPPKRPAAGGRSRLVQQSAIVKSGVHGFTELAAELSAIRVLVDHHALPGWVPCLPNVREPAAQQASEAGATLVARALSGVFMSIPSCDPLRLKTL